ncbi:MAG: ankyrin repeat domain-containing protein, partial [Archangium sp.]|nr:ankyrin repeat domain-containing protein [Archangium sp.]
MTFDEFIDALRAGEAASIAAAASFSPVDRSTALLAAVEFENEAAALALLQAGASPRYQDAGTLQSPLLLAVAHRSQTLVAALLAAGAEVDVRDSTGMSPLLLAASRDEVDLVKQLIAGGADLDLRSHQNGRAPLAPAAIKSPAVCATLLEARADLETTDHNDSSPLSGALLVNAYDCVELLVTRGAFVPEDARAKLPAAQKLLEAHTDAAEFERRAKVKP